MKLHRAMVAGLMVVASGLACGSAAADQPGQSAMPGINSRVGGTRAALPAPRSGLGRGGTLLNRSRTLLPPEPPSIQRTMPTSAFPASGLGSGRGNSIVPRTGGPLVLPPGSDGTSIGIGTGGVNIDGQSTSDRFRIKFHVGSGLGREHCHKPGHPNDHCHNVCYRPITWWGWYGNSWYDRPSVVYSGPWYGTDPFVATGQPGAYQPSAAAGTTASAAGNAGAQPRELTAIEKADLLWQAGRPELAVAQFKEYMKTAADDTEAMRFMALALIDQKKVDEAVALMAMAYDKTPQLASRPLPTTAIPGGETAMRKRVNAVSGYANRTKTGSAWLTLAVLVQGEGREGVAKTLVERARKAGLREDVARELEGALGE